MKKIYKTLILLHLIVYSLNSFCQGDYFSMVDTNVTWKQVEVNIDPDQWTYYDYFTDGDTIIDDIQYFKIFLNRDILIPYGFIRQTDDGKVYYRFTEQNLDYFCDTIYPLNEDLLLLDFSVEVGDTIVFPYSYYGEISIEIIVIINEIIQGENRKSIYFTGIDNETIYGNWIEGIGAQEGGFFNSWCPLPSGIWDELVCYANDSISIFPEGTNCFTVEINEYHKQFSIELSPNPAAEKISVSFKTASEQSYSIKIISLNGNELINKRELHGKSTIYVSQLTSGMYILQIELENGYRSTRKFVKE